VLVEVGNFRLILASVSGHDAVGFLLTSLLLELFLFRLRVYCLIISSFLLYNIGVIKIHPVAPHNLSPNWRISHLYYILLFDPKSHLVLCSFQLHQKFPQRLVLEYLALLLMRLQCRKNPYRIINLQLIHASPFQFVHLGFKILFKFFFLYIRLSLDNIVFEGALRENVFKKVPLFCSHIVK
jgi:hypothetical protein